MAIAVSSAFKEALKGPVDRSRLKIEVYFNGALGWVDLASYLDEQAGIGGLMEEIDSVEGGANANTLDFSLINDDGRFSRKNTASPYYGELVPNKPIRVSVVVGAESVRKFTGFVKNWGNKGRARTCPVACYDWAGILAARDIQEEVIFNPIAPGHGYTLTRVLERAAWLSGIRWNAVTTKDASWTLLDHDGNGVNEIVATYSAGATRAVYTYDGEPVMMLDLVDLFLPVAHVRGKALGQIAKIAQVVDGRVYWDAQGQLVFRARMYRGEDLTSRETFTVSSLDDISLETNYGGGGGFVELCNRAVVRSAPWAFSTNTAGELVEEELTFRGEDFAKNVFNAGERFPDYVANPQADDLFVDFPNDIKLFKEAGYPNAGNIILSSVDAADATKGTNGIRLQPGYPTFFTTALKLAFVNNGSGAERLDSLTIRAKLIKQLQGCRAVRKDEASIALYNQRDREIENEFIPSAKACDQLGAWHVADGKAPKDYVTLDVMYGCPWLELNDRITASEPLVKTLPAAEDFILKRVRWRWNKQQYKYTAEGVTPSPAFNVSSLPPRLAGEESLNINMRGAQAAALPPQIVDGVKNLVGLNNIPAFAPLVASVKKLTGFSPAITYSSGIAFDGSDIFVADYASSGRSVYKINSLTGTQIASRQVDPTIASAGDICVGGGLLFVSDQTNGRIRVTDAATFGPFTTKANLTGHSARGIIAAGGKLYCVGRADVGGLLKLYQWNSLTTTQKDNGDASYTLSTISTDTQQLAFDGRYLWITITNDCKIAKFDTQTNTLVYAEIDLGSGNQPMGIAHDGKNLWVSLSWGILLRFYPTFDAGGNIVYKQDPKFVIVNDGVIGTESGLLFDGTYLWAVTGGALVQISTLGEVVARYKTDSTMAGFAVFDGMAIWATGLNPNIYRVPRLVSGRQ